MNTDKYGPIHLHKIDVCRKRVWKTEPQ